MYSTYFQREIVWIRILIGTEGHVTPNERGSGKHRGRVAEWEAGETRRRDQRAAQNTQYAAIRTGRLVTDALERVELMTESDVRGFVHTVAKSGLSG